MNESKRHPPSVADVLGGKLTAVHDAVMALDNAVYQDDHFESWEHAMWASGSLEEAVEALRDAVLAGVRRAEDALEDEEVPS